jgi:hypothetical protein
MRKIRKQTRKHEIAGCRAIKQHIDAGQTLLFKRPTYMSQKTKVQGVVSQEKSKRKNEDQRRTQRQ